MHPALTRTDHRPWPLPQRPWLGRQSWRNLLFVHWPVPASVLRPYVPSSLAIDEYEGTSWVGIVPFLMADVMARGVPALPWISSFPELNVRLYVRSGDRPGVWFLSLDATNPLAVWTARKFFHLPYRKAAMRLRRTDHRQDGLHGTASEPAPREPAPRSTGPFPSLEPATGVRIDFESVHRGARFRATYEPTSDVYLASPGTLEHWLTERYCFYAQDEKRTLWRCDVHHVPWPLQRARASIAECTLLEDHGLPSATTEPLLHFSERVDVVTWLPERVA